MIRLKRRETMLTLQPAAVPRSSFWSRDAAYKITRDETEIGRIDLFASPRENADAHIHIQGRAFEAHILITGRSRWAHVPSHWVMRLEGQDLHSAVWESGKTWVTEAEEGSERLRLRRSTFGGSIAIEREHDQTRLGEIKWLRARLVPKPIPRRLELETSLALPETLEVFLMWIVVADDFRNPG
jgi:hypothetical protein